MTHPGFLALWKRLSPEAKLQACRDYIGEKDTDIADCCDRYAKIAHIRQVTWMRRSPNERATDLAKVLHHPEFRGMHAKVLKAFLLVSKQQLLTDFLNDLGIPNEKGCFSEADPPSEDRLYEAIRRLTALHPPEDCFLYFGFLLARGPEPVWVNLLGALQRHESSTSPQGERPADALKTAKSDEVPVSTEAEPLPEVADDFTTLDEVLVKTVVAAAMNSEGALSRQKLDDLIEEVISLNGDRRRSFFHRGFFHALFDVSFEFTFAAENHERRCWYMAGVIMGLLRQSAASRDAGSSARYVDDVLKEKREIVDELVTDGRLGCGKLVATTIYSHLVAIGEIELAAKMLHIQLPRLDDRRRLQLVSETLDDGARFLREGKLAEAKLLLEPALAGASHVERLSDGDEAYDEVFRRALRKTGQCDQALGNFHDARRNLEAVVYLRDCAERREALTDLGLIAGGFKTLRSILPGRDPSRWPTLLGSLAHGEEYFKRATAPHPDGEEVRGVRNAHFALGISAILKKPPEINAAVEHLERAYVGMVRRRDAYEVGGVISWTKFLLAIAHLEKLDAALATSARDLVDDSIAAGEHFPILLWQRCLEAAAIHDDATICLRIIEYLFQHRAAEAFLAIRGSSALLRSEFLRRQYNEMLATESRIGISERFAEWNALLKICQREGDAELAADVLGNMEELALNETPFIQAFIGLLGEPSGYSPGWDSEEAEMARARMLERAGLGAEAAGVYARRFYALAERATEHSLAQAREFLEKVRRLGETALLVDMERRQAACDSALALDSSAASAESRLRAGAKVSLLYVGGNEIQQGYDDRIQDKLSKDYPGLYLQFIHPGWSSNWPRALDEVKGIIRDRPPDAVLLSPLVRTQFGRALRKICNSDVPWFAITQRGQSGIRESIRRFASSVIVRRQSTGR